MEERLQHLILGSLLHDIGKVMQRAEVNPSDQTKSYMSQAGPTRDGHSTHYHVQWTDQFFEDHFADWTRRGLPEPANSDEGARRLAFHHHNPRNVLQEIVAQADRLSSGMERGEQSYEQNVHKRRRMTPVRALLKTSEGEPDRMIYSPLTELTSKDNSCYPFETGKAGKDEWLVPEYDSLWNGFLTDWQDRQPVGLSAICACLDALFERYFWSVPASTVDKLPDNSLYAHSRTTAAIAAALYLYHRDTDSRRREALGNEQQEKFLLVAGDLSGIQDYIFAIAHAGGGRVAKRLRARSFYLGRITQALAHKILLDVGLPFLNIVLGAGGKFYLLLPNTDDAKEKLDSCEKQCQTWLREAFQGQLAVNITSVTLAPADFMGKRIKGRFEELADALIVKKHQPLRTELINQNGWNEENFLLRQAIIKKESPTGQYDIEGPLGEEEESLGQQLARAKCMAFYDSTAGRYPILGDWSFSVAEDASRLPGGAYWLVSFERGAERGTDAGVPVHYEYRASHVPLYQPDKNQDLDEYVRSDADESIRPGQILPFSAIAQTANGRKTIAYLKADVDDLGFMLRCGLDWNPVGWTFSKHAAFSRDLEFFFSGRVENLLRAEYPMIYTVFSGGDDLLLVGPWDHVHNFARRLRDEWTRFTGENQALTLSVGISLSRPMTPVWAAQENAESALNRAKREPAHGNGSPKNQLCSFGHIVKWDDVESLFEDVDQLAHWLEDETVSTAFVRSLLYYHGLWSMYANEDRIEGLRYLPLLSYNLSRKIKVSEVRQWAEKLKKIEGSAIRNLGFVASYALNLNRG